MAGASRQAPCGEERSTAIVAPPSALAALVAALRRDGRTVVGPVLRGRTVVLAELEDASALPWGVGDEQAPGRYRTVARGDGAVFGHHAGHVSWKGFLHAPDLLRYRSVREGRSLRLLPAGQPPERLALLGVRPCDLAGIERLERVLLRGAHPDPAFAARREDLLVVAVACTEPGGTCFCASVGTGPSVPEGADLAVTERVAGGVHELLVEAGSERGRGLLPYLGGRPATAADLSAAREATAAARQRMGRTLETAGLREALRAAAESPLWDDVAARCLTCGSCTMVCPTCFCTTVEENADLGAVHAERWRRWDTCFSLDFSHLLGGSVRRSASSRYRQFLTHKLATFEDQFGAPGCVGCGRCITWCPAAIDLTQEARSLARASAGKE